MSNNSDNDYNDLWEQLRLVSFLPIWEIIFLHRGSSC